MIGVTIASLLRIDVFSGWSKRRIAPGVVLFYVGIIRGLILA